MTQILSKEKIVAIENSDNQDDLTRRQKAFFEWRTRRLRAKNKALLDYVKAEIEKSKCIEETK